MQHRQTANCGKLIYDNVDLHFTNHEKPGWWPIIDDYIAFACELTVAAAENISFGFNVKKLSYEAEAKREPIAGKTKCYTYSPKFILLPNNLSPNIVHLISTKLHSSVEKETCTFTEVEHQHWSYWNWKSKMATGRYVLSCDWSGTPLISIKQDYYLRHDSD